MPKDVIGLGDSVNRVGESELVKLIISHLSKGNKEVMKNIMAFHLEEVNNVSRAIIQLLGGNVITVRTLNTCFYETVRSLGYTTSLLIAPYRNEHREVNLGL